MGLFSAIKGKVKPLMQIDTTLTQSGQAADAKVVGNNLNNTSAEIGNVNNRVSALSGTIDKISKDVYRTNEGLPGYFGDGNTSRTITFENVGSCILYIASGQYGGFILMGSGGFRVNNEGITPISYNQAHYWKGVLTIEDAETYLNVDDSYYEYVVL